MGVASLPVQCARASAHVTLTYIFRNIPALAQQGLTLKGWGCLVRYRRLF